MKKCCKSISLLKNSKFTVAKESLQQFNTIKQRKKFFLNYKLKAVNRKKN